MALQLAAEAGAWMVSLVEYFVEATKCSCGDPVFDEFPSNDTLSYKTLPHYFINIHKSSMSMVLLLILFTIITIKRLGVRIGLSTSGLCPSNKFIRMATYAGTLQQCSYARSRVLAAKVDEVGRVSTLMK